MPGCHPENSDRLAVAGAKHRRGLAGASDGGLRRVDPVQAGLVHEKKSEVLRQALNMGIYHQIPVS